MSKVKRIDVLKYDLEERIAVLKYDLEKRERELIAAHEAKEKAGRDVLEKANRFAARAHEYVRRVKAASALISELDDYTDAYVVKEQAVNIVNILIASARDLSFQLWIESTREGPDDKYDGTQEDRPSVRLILRRCLGLMWALGSAPLKPP